MYFLFFLILLAVLFLTDAVRLGITPNVTPKKVSRAIENFLPEIGEGIVHELGSGFGLSTLSLARQFPRHQIIGYEKSLIPYLVSLLVVKGQKNIRIRFQDFTRVNSFENPALLFCYLSTGLMKILRQRLPTLLPPGTKILSHTFAFPRWEAEKFLIVNDLYQTKIYLYKIPSPKKKKIFV